MSGEARVGTPVRSFMAECFWPGVTERQLVDAGVRAAPVARGLQAQGVLARFVGSILVPEDEIALCLIEAPSLDAACEIARRASLPSERVIEIVPLGFTVHTSASPQQTLWKGTR